MATGGSAFWVTSYDLYISPQRPFGLDNLEPYLAKLGQALVMLVIGCAMHM
jgi:hypothetical protein